MTVFVNPALLSDGSGSYANPWNTWTGKSFSAGEVYLGVAGGLWAPAGTTQCILVSESGSAGSPITFGSYDIETGERTLVKHRIIGDGSTRYGVKIETASTDVIVEDFDVSRIGDGGVTTSSFALTTSAATTSTAKRITFRRCDVHDLIIGSQLSTTAISLRGTDNLVEWCNIWNIPDDGINYTGQRLTFRHNSVWNVNISGLNGADCVQGNLDTSGAVVAYNYLENLLGFNKQVIIFTNSGATPTGGLTEGNVIVCPPDRLQGIYDETPGKITRQNIVYDGQYGIRVLGAGATVDSNVVINRYTTDSSYSAIRLGTDGQTAINNTLVSIAGLIASQSGLYAEADHTGHTLINNLLIGWFRGLRIDPLQLEDYNRYIGCTTPVTFASPKALGAHSLVLTFEEALLHGDYRPLVGSPLLGAGLHTTWRRDHNGRQRPNPPSIGAYDVAALRKVIA